MSLSFGIAASSPRAEKPDTSTIPPMMLASSPSSQSASPSSGGTSPSVSSPSSASSANPIHPRCEIDPIDPIPGGCLTMITKDDRQGVSHFFGRNKSETASIDEDMFPILCRTHYQEKLYRFEAGSFAGFQCDCILKTLGKMAEKRFVDVNGWEWPWWCGFELQLQKQKEGVQGSKSNAMIILRKDGGQMPRKNKKAGRAPIPEWLQELCTPDVLSKSLNGQRNSVRYDFEQLALIVNTLKTWCITNNARLPSVEAIPITIGTLHQQNLLSATIAAREGLRSRNAAELEVRKIRKRALEELKGGRARKRLTMAQEKLAEAKALTERLLQEKALAARELEGTRETVPRKRTSRQVVGERDALVRSTGDENFDPEIGAEDEVSIQDSENIGVELATLSMINPSLQLLSSSRTTERRKQSKPNAIGQGKRNGEGDQAGSRGSWKKLRTCPRWSGSGCVPGMK